MLAKAEGDPHPPHLGDSTSHQLRAKHLKSQSKDNKPRLVFDCVLLPTYDQLLRRRIARLGRTVANDPIKSTKLKVGVEFATISDIAGTKKEDDGVQTGFKAKMRSGNALEAALRNAMEANSGTQIEAKEPFQVSAQGTSQIKVESTLHVSPDNTSINNPESKVSVSVEENFQGAVRKDSPRQAKRSRAKPMVKEEPAEVQLPVEGGDIAALPEGHAMSVITSHTPARSSKKKPVQSKPRLEIEDDILQIKAEPEDRTSVPKRTATSSSKPKKEAKVKARPEDEADIKPNMRLPREIIETRFAEAKLPFKDFKINLESSIRDQMVSRRFMSMTYGGNAQAVFATPGKDFHHGYNDFMYLSLYFQPLAPTKPGSPGLWINGPWYKGADDRGVKRVLTRVKTSPRALWLYQGQYRVKQVKPLTKEEWATTDVMVRNTWAHELSLDTCQWGEYLRCRIYARREWGREMKLKEMDSITAIGGHNTVTKEEVALALTRGDDTLSLYTMECVGYDTNFQKEVASKWLAYQASRNNSSESPKKRKADSTEQDVKSPKKRKTVVRAQKYVKNEDDHNEVQQELLRRRRPGGCR